MCNTVLLESCSSLFSLPGPPANRQINTLTSPSTSFYTHSLDLSPAGTHRNVCRHKDFALCGTVCFTSRPPGNAGHEPITANERDKTAIGNVVCVTFPAQSMNEWKHQSLAYSSWIHSAPSITDHKSSQFILYVSLPRIHRYKTPRAIMTLLSGGALQAQKVRKPKGRLGTSRSLGSPYTSCSHNALAAFPNHKLFAPQTQRGKKVSKLLFLTLNHNQLLLSDTIIL